MSTSPFLPLPATLSIDAAKQEAQALTVYLHATTQVAPCPNCGTPGSRVHSRYIRTVADVACGGQRHLTALSEHWNAGCQSAVQLYEAIVAQGYTGSKRSVERIVAQFRPNGNQPVSRQTITQAKAPSARSAALMLVRPPEHRTKDQTVFIDQLCQREPQMATVFALTQTFGQLLRQRQGGAWLEQWKAAVQASGIAELKSFADGLAQDAEAVTNACTEPWSNGMVEGFNHKVKLIKRSSYGQAGFPLLQRRVLLHPAARPPVDPEQRRRSSKTISIGCPRPSREHRISITTWCRCMRG